MKKFLTIITIAVLIYACKPLGVTDGVHRRIRYGKIQTVGWYNGQNVYEHYLSLDSDKEAIKNDSIQAENAIELAKKIDL